MQRSAVSDGVGLQVKRNNFIPTFISCAQFIAAFKLCEHKIAAKCMLKC